MPLISSGKHLALNMGKKRKANGQPFGEPKAKISKDESLIVNSYKDVADSGDEFDLARDKILIDETPAQKQRRKLQEQGTSNTWATTL